jgi:secondary thiamine-phosphate synthase enzyme
VNKKLVVETRVKVEVLNIMAQVEAAAREVGDGVMLCSIPHTTAALLVCEDDDALRADLVKVAENWLAHLEPFTHRRNDNPNAAAHVLSAFGGFQILVPVSEGKPMLGTYQNVLLLEMDGPKKRELWVHTISH